MKAQGIKHYIAYAIVFILFLPEFIFMGCEKASEWIVKQFTTE